MPWSSNGTYLCEVRCGDERRAQAIYKPRRGERPLWDFPSGLDQREVAAYELSRGARLGPRAGHRATATGPLGVGSLQDFVDADFEQHYFTLYEDEAHHPALRGDVRLRPRRQQHRPQERPRASSASTAASAASTTA